MKDEESELVNEPHIAVTHADTNIPDNSTPVDREKVARHTPPSQEADSRVCETDLSLEMANFPKQFMIFFPSDVSAHIENVKVMSLDCSQIHNRELECNGNGIYTYKCTVEIPIQQVKDDIAYWYEVQSPAFQDRRRSDNQHLSNAIEQRDIFSKKYEIESVKAYLKDIIYQNEHTATLKESVMQIEELLRKKTFSQTVRQQFIKSVSDDLKKSDHKLTAVLCAVVIGNCLDNSGMLTMVDIDKSKAELMLSKLVLYKLEEFPSSCEQYLSVTCLCLSRLCISRGNGLYQYMAKCYPLLKEALLCQWFEHQEAPIASAVETDIETIEDLCSLAIKRITVDAIDEEIACDVKTFICRFVDRTPLNVSLKVIRLLQQQDDRDSRNIFDELMESLFTRTCLHSRKSKDSSDLVQLWDFIETREELVSIYKTKFEEFILKDSISMEPGNQNQLQKMISNNLLFDNIAPQMELLQTLCTSEHFWLHSLFADALKMSKFSACLNEMNVNIFQTWFETFVKFHVVLWENNQVKAIYTQVFGLLEIIPSPRKGEFKILMDDLMVNFMKKLSTKEFLSGLSDADSAYPEQYKDMCVKHVEVVLNHNRKRLRPQDIFNELVDSKGRLLLNTRLTAAAAVFALEAHHPLDRSLSIFDCFLAMTKEADMWKTILSCYGTFKDLLEECPSHKTATSCISEILKLLTEHDLPYQFYTKANIQDHFVREILHLMNFKKIELDVYLEENKRIHQEEKHKINVVQKVVHYVGGRIGDVLPCTSGLFVKTLDDLVHRYDERKLSEHLSGVKDLFQNQDVYQQCSLSSEVVQSQVYWNTFKKKACEFQFQNEDDVLDDLCYLFGDKYVQNHPKNTMCAGFVCKVLEMANKIYTDEWKSIQDNSEVFIENIFSMFMNCFTKMDEEIHFAEVHLRHKISEACKTCLLRLGKLETIKVSVNAAVYAIKAFGLSFEADAQFCEAVTAFRELLTGDSTKLTFSEVGKQLDIVFPIAENIDEITTDIIQCIGRSTSLIEFLRRIINEDIRHLIDAVDDISEQHVSESTVSALIEVKRFFKPLLEKEKLTCIGLLQSIRRQAQSLGKLARLLPSNINDCIIYLHNLISLYNNVENRGEQTKQIIHNIVRQGKFHFQLTSKQTVCDITASYTHSNTHSKTKQKVMHSKSALCDLRSRALLLMNSDRHVNEKNMSYLNKFVRAINCCLDVAEHTHELYSSGHLKYPKFKKTEPFDHLDDLRKSLMKDLDNWNVKLKQVREKFYLMNFIQGSHIHVLHRYLHKGCECEMGDIILKFLHPSLVAKDLQQEFSIHKNELESRGNFDILTALGMALNSSFKRLAPFQRTVQATVDKKKRLTDIVGDGRLVVARIEEGNVLVVKTLLALYLPSNRIPEPREVLLCTRETTWSEVELLLGRCFNAFSFYGTEALYCIANVEILPSEIHFRLVEELKNLNKDVKFKLVIICKGSSNHPFIDEFFGHVTSVRPLSDESVRSIFLEVCPNVFTYTSVSAGLGKTTAIMSKANKNSKTLKTLHISGPVLKRKLIERLKILELHENDLLHIDIGFVDNALELDMFLFELLILKFSVVGGLAVDLSTSHVCIEIANTINNTLRNSLQTAVTFQRIHMKWNNFNDFIVSTEINSPVQVVCHYLYSLEKHTLDKTDLMFSTDICLKPLSTKVCRYLLRKYFSLSDTFIVTNTCIGMLADQLKKMSNSTFFKTSRIRDMTEHKSESTIKSSMVNALIEVSKDLARRSVDAYRSTQRETLEGKRGDITAAATEHAKHMIRWEDSNHLIYVFHNQNIQTISPMYRELSSVPSHIKDLFESQMKRKLCDFKSFPQDELQDVLQKVARTNPMPLPSDKLVNLSKDYALTPDNLLKMVLIILRIKSRVPVIVMGETGCGKTSLIRYLSAICEVEFEVISIHAGVEEITILNKVLDYNKKAAQQLEQEKWLFLDEINTSEYIGLISDMICHHKCLGKVLSPNLIILSACNPYKLRSFKTILTSGLKGKVKTDELSRLVYRVRPLPEMLVDYVWDFGSLTERDEKLYIDKMIKDVFEHNTVHGIFVDLLSMSQKCSRSIEETTSSVSLRDIQRCKILTVWFHNVLLEKTPKKEMTYRGKTYNKKFTAIILALAHCYLSRFSDKNIRKKYLDDIESVFLMHDQPTYTAMYIQEIINQEQGDILLRMDLPPGTAQNTALRENVFVVLVCILNRIPIFVVGKPGCSKSLSLQVIMSNLRGKDSRDDFFKTLPQLYCVSFQGSESSTSDGILNVFEKAEKYQKANDSDSVLSVVILDEIGLAEISRFNPLKVLHNLLEPDGNIRPDVAVVGVSNWSLDASKMNRAIHLSRPDMDEEELYETAKSISDSFQKEKKEDILRHMEEESYSFKTQDITEHLKGIAKSYTEYMLSLRFENFHGLRDYYSLIKYIAREISCAKQKPSEEKIQGIISCGIERNFGGLPAERETLFNKFHLDSANVTPVLKLVTDNVTDPLARHLMIITSGQSAVGIIEKSLKAARREKREILFGSQFEEDLTDDYNYRILSRIILCMEQGMVLILKDLESIYGSLYDMLNKNYTEIGKKKHCRVALGAYSNPICHVHENFRCIVLVDENHVDFTDPPFMNRFEKQNVNFSDIIDESQRDTIIQAEEWLEQFSILEGKHFTEEDTVPIYSSNLVASYVIKNEESDKRTTPNTLKKDFMWIMKPDAVIRSHMAASEKVQNEAENVQDQFLRLPLHRGLSGLLQFHRDECGNDNLMTIVFTNSSIHTRSLYCISDVPKQIEKLGTFKSEKQLSVRLQYFWMESHTQVLFLQCSAIDDEKHIMLAKSVIERNRSDFISSNPSMFKHVYLIIHLDKSKGISGTVSQINYLSGWQLVTLDSIELPPISLPELCCLSLFEAVKEKRPMTKYIVDQLCWTFTRIKYSKTGRGFDSIKTVLNKMRQCDDFIAVVEEQVCSWVYYNNRDVHHSEWLEAVASDSRALETSLTFVNAIERYILQTIDAPLCKYIYKMECMGIIDSYFVCDGDLDERRKTWSKLLANTSIFSIKNIHDEMGPETLDCNNDDLSLKMPFSQHIWESVETTKEEYFNSVTTLKGLLKLYDDEDLPTDVVDKLLKKQEMVILDKIPGLEAFLYGNCVNDYIDDFCNLVSFEKCPGLTKIKKLNNMKWILEQRTNLYPNEFSVLLTNLHTTFWSNARLVHAQMQLFELCQSETLSEEMDIVDTIITELRAAKMNIVPEHYEYDEVKEKSDTFQNGQDQDTNGHLTTLYTREECVTKQTNLRVRAAVLLNNDFTNDFETSAMSSTNKAESTNIEDVTEINTYSTDKANETEFKVNKDTPEVDTMNLTVTKNESVSANDLKQINETNEFSTDDFGGIKYQVSENRFGTANAMPVNDNEKMSEGDSDSAFSLTLSKLSDNSSVISDDGGQKKINTEYQLVDFLCDQMFPTDEVVAHHDGLVSWRWKVNYMLRLAANVSDEPSSLHALRLCNDIAAELFPKSMRSDSLAAMADIFKSEKALDNKAVFLTFISMLNERKNDMNNECQNVFANYLLRCLGLNSETKAMEMFLLALKKGMIPDKRLTYLKLPLSTTLKSEPWGMHMKILQKPNMWDDEESTAFILSLDRCLNEMFTQREEFDALSNLVIDIFVEIYKKAFTGKTDGKENDFKSLFFDGHRCLTTRIGLSFFAGVAYCKAYIQCIVLREEIVSDESLAAFLPILKSTTKGNITQSFLLYFMKMQELTSPIAMFWIKGKSQKDGLAFFDTLGWFQEEDSDISLCAEMCPMRVHCPMTAEFEVLLIKSTDGAVKIDEWERIFFESKNDSKRIVSILGAAMCHFYLPRIYTEIDDTKNMQARELQEISEKCTLTAGSRQLLKCLLGKHHFEVPAFMINSGSRPTEFYISSVLVSLYILLHAEEECSTSGQMSVLALCLLKPTSVGNTYLPGVPDSTISVANSFTEDTCEKTFYCTCTCGLRLCSTQSEIRCVNCSTCRNGEDLVSSTEREECTYETGFIPSNSETNVRKLSPVIFNILAILIKGCLIGSVAIGHASTNDMEKIGVPENALQVLWNDIESHWKHLLKIMNMEEYHLSYLFQALFVKIRKFICEEKARLATIDDRSKWEESFIVLVNDVLVDKFSSVRDIFHAHRCSCAPDLFEMESFLRELDDTSESSTEHKQPPMLDLFRLYGQPSMANFVSELYDVRQKYPFLLLVLQSYGDLSIPKHITSIIQWHLLVASNVSYILKKRDFMNMTVTEFIHLTEDKEARTTRRKCFDAFKKAWVDLKASLKHEDAIKVCSDRFHGNTKMSECSIPDKKSAIYKLLCFLVQIHNSFLDKALAVAHECNSVKFLCRKPGVSMFPCVNVTKVTAKQLVNFNMAWEDCLINYSQSDLAYGHGRQVVYNFSSIEKYLAVDLLNGKSYVIVENAMPRIIFTDELYRNFAFLIKELRKCITQSDIPISTIHSIHTNHEKDPKMATELLTHLGIVMALLKKTKGDPDMALVDYVDNWKIIMTRSLPEDLLPSPSNCIKLGHVVALHEILEELSATSIVDALEEDYRQRIDADMESHFDKLIQNQLKVSEAILGTMKRFVYRCLSVRDADPELQMVEYLADESFWPVDVCADERIHMGDEVFYVGDLIPQGLMVSHVYSTVTFLEEEIEKKRSSDQKLSEMVIGLNVNSASRNPARRKDQRIKKKSRGLANF